MIINKKTLTMIVMPLFLAVSCGSSSSDIKKVEDHQSDASKSESSQVDVKQESTKLALADLVEGKHYVKISPEMQTDAPKDKVEVIELMWLGCPHCYSLEPAIAKYKKNHPDFIDFKQVPAMLNPSWAKDAETYYLADILDPTGEKELIPQIFHAIHDQRRNLRNPATLARLFKQFGYTEEQIANVKNSMEYQAKLNRAKEIGEASQAQSVPAFMINGKYRTSVYMAGGEEKLFEVIDLLTKKEKAKSK